MGDRGLRIRDLQAPVVQVPAWLRQLSAVVMTASAAVLYAIVLGVAIYRTISEGDPVFSDIMTRAAAVLSGMVGAVVTAGFARSGKGVSVQVAGVRSDLVGEPIGWLKRNFYGLADTLGLPLLPELVLWTEPDPTHQPVGDPIGEAPPYEVDEPTVNKTSLILSVLYFGVFFFVGLVAFVTSIIRPEVPDLLTNSAWVWLGSIVSSGYSFFALDSSTTVV